MRNFMFLLLLLTVSSIMFSCGGDGPTEPTIPNPIASFTESGTTVTPATIEFQNTSENADAYVWRFGDGDTTTITNPTHTYQVYGDYLVTLTAINSESNRSDTFSKTLTIDPGSVFIDRISITDMPFTDSYGTGWDLWSGPDVFAQFASETNSIFITDTYYLDVAPSDLPLSWNVPGGYEITDWSSNYTFGVWDFDDLSEHDLIGYTNYFTINQLANNFGYASVITVTNTNESVSFDIVFRWE